MLGYHCILIWPAWWGQGHRWESFKRRVFNSLRTSTIHKGVAEVRPYWMPTGWNWPQKQYEKGCQTLISLFIGGKMILHRLLRDRPKLEWGQDMTPKVTEEAKLGKLSCPVMDLCNAFLSGFPRLWYRPIQASKHASLFCVQCVCMGTTISREQMAAISVSAC